MGLVRPFPDAIGPGDDKVFNGLVLSGPLAVNPLPEEADCCVVNWMIKS